jgi:hypothetical protein
VAQACTAGEGDWFSHNTYLRDLETDGQHDTREGSSRSDPAHCKIFFMYLSKAVRLIKTTLLFLIGEGSIPGDTVNMQPLIPR